ncbi:MAG: hypothetical protein CBC71_01545 [Rhodobacteraceae bacterium TMED111]|nr:MAG: hypothetical protein CBC71_01545 [Rhodobacteraceae bacterium TMED111]|tara:strand:+ start:8041 stop:9099 length:1059 start_codon:yes stop_codon:yes gene_type:complete
MAVFNVSNLECRYKNSTHSVLQVEQLQIDEGEVVFFLGSSGVGKSTILETLGLMNNTIHSNSNTKLSFHEDTNEVDFLKIWQKKENLIAGFRKNNLSFIFQSTNLFPTLTAFENVKITTILQDSDKTNINQSELGALVDVLKSFLTTEKVQNILSKISNFNEAEAYNRIVKYLIKVFPKDTVEEILGVKYKLDNEGKLIKGKNGSVYESPKMITELSGGQRQRLAFVRAVASKYKVLLADEPTGNLDEANADNLIAQLVDDVHQKSAIAIIVTHDIELALKHADKIVFIDKKQIEEKESKRHFGKISKAETYIKNDNSKWENAVDYITDNKPSFTSVDLQKHFLEKIKTQSN